MYADIVFPQNYSRPFTYRIPPELVEQIHCGSWVIVPFGRMIKLALVIQLKDECAISQPRGKRIHVKDLLGLATSGPLTALDPDYIDFARDLAEYYLQPIGACLRLLQPPHGFSARIRRRWVLSPKGHRLTTGTSRLSASHAAILARLANAPQGLTIETLKKYCPDLNKILKSFKRRGLIHEDYSVTFPPHTAVVRQEASPELPDGSTNVSRAVRDTVGESSGYLGLRLSAEDLEPECPVWHESLRQALRQKLNTSISIQPPTFTVVSWIHHAIRYTLDACRQILILCPHHARAAMIGEQLRNQWGAMTAIYQQGLSQQEKIRIGEGLRLGHIHILIGTRSALFTPIPSLGLIFLDQEEDSLFQEEQSPYYHVREAASMLAQRKKAVLIISSAHPSLETYHRFFASARGTRPDTNTLNDEEPNVRLVPLQSLDPDSFLTHDMATGIDKALGRDQKVVIFLNRKGFSRALSCEDCGWVATCSQCGITMTMFRQSPGLSCRLCGHRKAIPVNCPSCRAIHLRPLGFGTERMEDLVRRRFPSANIKRFDSFAIQSIQDSTALWNEFQGGRIQILIGTQMMIQTFPPAVAHFIGIPYADADLHLPDFRAAERVYHQLRRILELAKPRTAGGTVLIQTALPNHHVFQAIAQQRPAEFYEHELHFRKALGYPPYAQLFLLRVSGKRVECVKNAAQMWAARLGSALLQSAEPPKHNASIPDSVLGPLLTVGKDGRGTSNYTILVKAGNGWKARVHIRETLEAIRALPENRGLIFSVRAEPTKLAH